MKKTNLYFRNYLTRNNHTKERVINYFITICSFPKLFIEVFIRSKFGRRYINTASIFCVATILFILPFVAHTAGAAYGYYSSGSASWSAFSFMGRYLTWYGILAAFLYKAIKHRLAIRKKPGEFDFNWFGKSSGVIHPQLRNLDINGWKPSIRQLEVFIEPAIPFILGLFLCILHQPIGLLLIISSVVYSGSYAALYYQGDEYILDMIDSMILNKTKEDVFTTDKTPEETMGVTFRGKRPSSEELRVGLFNQFVRDENDVPEVK